MNIQYEIDNATAAIIMLSNIDIDDEDILLIDGDKEHFRGINISKLVYEIIKEIKDNDSENYS